jgi:large subunit ribosomal protein L27
MQDSQAVKAGQIIIRQRGSKYAIGSGIKQGGDDTLYAKKDGIVKFSNKIKTAFDGSRRRVTVVAVL